MAFPGSHDSEDSCDQMAVFAGGTVLGDLVFPFLFLLQLTGEKGSSLPDRPAHLAYRDPGAYLSGAVCGIFVGAAPCAFVGSEKRRFTPCVRRKPCV